MKRVAPRALFVHCHCHLLQLACVQAANLIPGIKCVCDLDIIVDVFSVSPKRTKSQGISVYP